MPSRLEVCAALRHWSGSDWHRFPEWTQFFLQLGSSIKPRSSHQERLCVALSLFDRSYVAMLSSVGYLVEQPIHRPSPELVKQHFAKLLALPDPRYSPTALTYVKQGRRIQGVFAGVHVEKGTHLVKTLVQANEAGRSGGLTHFLGESDAMHIQIDEERTPTISRLANGRALVSHGEFISHFYTHDDLHMMRLAALIDVTIVGRINSAHEEASGLRCGIKHHGNSVDQGCLNDILQIDRFLGEGATPRTRLLSTIRNPDPPSSSAEAGLVVLDGSDAVIKWAPQFPHSQLLAILDRTEPQYLEALSQINARFLTRASDFEWLGSAPVPRGVDVMAFYESKQ